jgi:hypothetical protein
MPKPIPSYSIRFTKKELSIITHTLDLLLQEMEDLEALRPRKGTRPLLRSTKS